MTIFRPVAVRRIEGERVEFVLEDGSRRSLSNERLRLNCPCALCKERRGELNHEKPLSGKPRSLSIVESAKSDEVFLEEIWPVGNYALGFRWRDGHNDGIYSFDLLRELVLNAA